MSVPTGPQYGQIRRGRMAADVLREQFTQISNSALRDPRLSFKARGILAWLASHEDGYGCSVASIQAASESDGRDAVRAALKELQQFGYLTMQQTRDPETGKLGSSDYVVTDIPVTGEPLTGNPSTVATRGNGESSQVRTVDGFAVDGKSPTKNTNPKNTSKKTIPADSSSSSSPKSPREPCDGDAKTTGMNPDDVHELVCDVISIRPEWQTPGIRAQVLQVAHLPYAAVRAAFVEAAGDRKFYTPMHLASAAEARHRSDLDRVGARERAGQRVQDLRREINDDVSGRAKPETRAAMMERLRSERQAAVLAAQEKRTATGRGSGTAAAG